MLNSIHPGTIMTPLVKELASRGPGGLEAYLQLMEQKHPIGHAGEPEDVAYAITGAALVVDGGYTAI